MEINETKSPDLRKMSSFLLLGVRIDALQIPDVIATIERWIDQRDRCHYIAVTGMHGVTEARHDPVFKAILNAADMVVPDGMPLVWIGRLRGKNLARRVYGPELMMTFCTETASHGYRHFLFGGAPGLPEKLSETLRAKHPALQVAGTFSPPFRPVSPDEDEEILDMINCSAPDILWVGLSTPKQERWMHKHRDRLNVPVVVGVGAAFDINSGTKKQAPSWMREHGLEWFFRLLQEPRRLWRRYILYGSEFLFFAALELFFRRKRWSA
jgi:N-acetylglucosaminyldiphosphoundecaprenol N-acetyl-beta-D-mannosaminyltransferase